MATLSSNSATPSSTEVSEAPRELPATPVVTLSIRTKILLVFLIGFTAPVLIAAWSSYRTARGIIERHLVRQQAEVADQIAHDLLDLEEQSRQQLNHLSRNPSLLGALGGKSPFPEPLLLAFSDMNPRWTELTVYDRLGRSVWTRGSAPKTGFDPFFLGTAMRGEMQSPVVVDSRGRSTRFGARVLDRWELGGAVTATLDLAVLDPAFRSLRAYSATRALIWDDRGIVFGSNLTQDEEHQLDAFVDLRALGRDVLAGSDERVHREVVLGNEPLLLVAASVPETISSATTLPGEHWFLATLAPVTQAFAELRRFQTGILFFLVLTFLAVAGFLLWISRRVSGPLIQMTGFAEALARGGRDVRVNQSGRDEIGRLGRSLDTLAASLQQYESELVGKEALATLGQTSALVAHEIRNPLNGIRGSVQFLQLRFPDDAVINEYAGLMLDRVDWLARFVDSLLRFARLPAPRWTTKSAGSLFARAIEPFRERADRARVRLATDAGRDEPIACDEDQIVELLQNLVHNALDAVGTDGEISLSSARTGEGIELRVRDSGPGIDPALRARLFVPFNSSKREGTGLGLVMCRMIAGNHGGMLELDESGGGACFVVRLPSEGPRQGPAR